MAKYRVFKYHTKEYTIKDEKFSLHKKAELDIIEADGIGYTPNSTVLYKNDYSINGHIIYVVPRDCGVEEISPEE